MAKAARLFEREPNLFVSQLAPAAIFEVRDDRSRFVETRTAAFEPLE
jgi:hypothetical protein